MSAVTGSDFPRLTSKAPFGCKRKRPASFQPGTNATWPSRKLYSVNKPNQFSQDLSLLNNLNPCEPVFDALADTSLKVKDKEYVWRIFCHIKTMRKKLLYCKSEQKRLKTESLKTRGEVEECKNRYLQLEKVDNLTIQCNTLASNRSSEIETLQKRMLELSKSLESEKVNSRSLLTELARKKARAAPSKKTVVHSEREQLLEKQVKQLTNLLILRSGERSLGGSQIVNEYNKIKGNYDQALIMVRQLKARLAFKQ